MSAEQKVNVDNDANKAVIKVLKEKYPYLKNLPDCVVKRFEHFELAKSCFLEGISFGLDLATKAKQP